LALTVEWVIDARNKKASSLMAHALGHNFEAEVVVGQKVFAVLHKGKRIGQWNLSP